MHITVTRSGGFAGLTIRRELDTAGRGDEDDVRRLVERCALDTVAAHQPAADRFVYAIDVDGRTATLGENELTTDQRELVHRVLAQ